MSNDYFSDENKRFFKVAHLRHPKKVYEMKNRVKVKDLQMETYL